MLVGEAVQAVGGWVTDVHALGSLQVVVAFVIPDGQHHALRRALGAATFQLQESHWEAEGREGEIAGAITVIPRDG
jgi:hypothetical protein